METAPSAQLGDQKLRQRLEILFDLERGTEQLVGVREQSAGFITSNLLGYVGEEVDGKHHFAGIVLDRAGVHPRPAHPRTAGTSVADHFLDHLFAHQDPPPRETIGREDRSGLIDHLKSSDQVGHRGPQQLFGRSEADQAGSQVVGVNQLS